MTASRFACPCAMLLASVLLASCGGQSIAPQLSQNAAVLSPNTDGVGMSQVHHGSHLVQHHHYKLIDMGTFGGPTSVINDPFFGTNLSNNGVPTGWSAFSTPTGPYSNLLICGSLDGFVPYITHAFEWNGTVRDLGALYPAKTHCSWSSGVNRSGTVVGASENGQIDPIFGVNEARAVAWVYGKITDLGTLGGYESAAFAINDRGQIVGNSTNAIPDPYCFGNSDQNRAWLLQGGKMKDLGTLGGNCAGTTNGGINENGWIIGQSTTSAIPNPITGNPPWDPFVWRKGIRMTDLGSLGGAWGDAYGLNGRGQIFGVSSIKSDPGACNGFPDNGDYNCHPFLWEPGKKLRDLSTTSVGGTPQQVQGINGKGEMVGVGVFKDAPYPDAFIWRHGVMTDLGHLRGCGSIAHAINSRGQVVGFVGPCNSKPQYIEAFLWENGSIVDLNELIPRDSRLHLVTADDINDRGEIDGTGVPPGVSPQKSLSQGRGFLLIPCDNNHKNIEGCDYSPVNI